MEVPMGPFRSMRTLGAGAVIAVTAAASLDAAKPAPAPANLSCTITFDDTLSYTEPGSMTSQTVATAVQSDGRSAYVDGADAVQCYVNNQPGSGNYQNVFVNADSRSARFLWMPGQVALTPYSRGGYTSFENRQPGYFEITNI